jgi:hypothetical protein
MLTNRKEKIKIIKNTLSESVVLLNPPSINLCEQAKLKITVYNIQLRLFPENEVIKGPID